MILQRVNFYHGRFRPQRDFFSVRNSFLYLFCLVLCLFVGNMVLHGYMAEKQAELARQEEAARIMVADSSQVNHANACKTALDDLLDLEFRYDSFRIAPLLEQFAHVQVPGIWLTGVKISQAGAEVLIHGAAFSQLSERLPQFVRTLVQHKAFIGYHLKAFQLEKDAKSSTIVASGNLSTRPAGVLPAGLVDKGQSIKTIKKIKFRITVNKEDGAARGIGMAVPDKD